MMSKRNARERKRVRVINNTLKTLREKLPVEWTSNKMSKLEILRKSTLYIRRLMELSGQRSLENSRMSRALDICSERSGVNRGLPIGQQSVLRGNKYRLLKKSGSENGIFENEVHQKMSKGGGIFNGGKRVDLEGTKEGNCNLSDDITEFDPDIEDPDDFVDDMLDQSNMSEELMHVDKFKRT